MIFRGDGRVVDDQSDLAPVFELDLAQALAADERARAVADDGAHVQAHAVSVRTSMPRILALHAADHAHRHALGGALLQQLDDRRVLDLGVVDRELLPGARDERASSISRAFSGLTTRFDLPGA